MKDFTVPIAAIGAVATAVSKDWIGWCIGMLTVSYLLFKNINAALKAVDSWKHRNNKQHKVKHTRLRKEDDTDL